MLLKVYKIKKQLSENNQQLFYSLINSKNNYYIPATTFISSITRIASASAFSCVCASV